MAQKTKYIAQKAIVRLNGKSYEPGDTITGLKSDQEKRLKDLKAIATEKDSGIEATGDNGAKAEKPKGSAETDGDGSGTGAEDDGKGTDDSKGE
jgi:hypothetical protein